MGTAEKSMELEKVLHMRGGNDETSYAQVAYVAKRVIAMTKPIREEAMAKLFSQEDQHVIKTTLCVADLGCASGPNTLNVVSELIITSEKIRHERSTAELEYQVYLNDLPGNDFGSVFISLPRLYQEVNEQVGLKSDQCFVAGVPGSFYGRLFPRQSLHFVHSSYSLYWLSQVPEGVEANKRNVYLTSTSPTCVVKAYKDQFKEDTTLFLKSRSEELVKGGQMVLTYWGRTTEDPKSSESTFVWDMFSSVFNQLISEGIIEEEKVEAFNIPVYHPSSTEVADEVGKEGSFVINTVNVSQVSFDGEENGMSTIAKRGEPPSRLMRSVVEPIFASHFGTAVIDEIFERYSRVAEDFMSRQKVPLTNVTISVTKK